MSTVIMNFIFSINLFYMNLIAVMFQSFEKVEKVMRQTYSMYFEEAKEFGLVDKVSSLDRNPSIR